MHRCLAFLATWSLWMRGAGRHSNRRAGELAVDLSRAIWSVTETWMSGAFTIVMIVRRQDNVVRRALCPLCLARTITSYYG